MKLQIKVPLVVVGILFVIGLISGGTILYYQRRASINQFEHMAMALAGAVRGSLEQSMLTGERKQTQESVIRIREEDMVREVVIFSPQSIVAISSELADIGKVLPNSELRQVIQSGEVFMRTERRNGKSELWVLTPVFNKSECQHCHSSDGKILGAIKVGLNATNIDKHTRETTLFIGLLGALTFVIIGIGLAFSLKQTILNPLSRLTTSARKLSQGDYSQRANKDMDDEIGILSGTFNEMAVSVEKRTQELEASRQELARWNLGLEDKIQQRTKELSALNAVITAVSRSFNLKAILNDALPIILEAVGVEGGAVHLLDESGQLVIIVNHELPPEYIQKINSLNLGWENIGSATLQEQLIILNNQTPNPGDADIGGSLFYASFPMKSKNRVLGVLTLASYRAKALHSDDVRLVSAMADAIGIAIDNARAAQRLEEANRIREDLLKKLISAQEEERRRIARELHDDASQYLAALAISLQAIAEDLPERYRDEKKRLDMLNEQAVRTLGGIRNLALELRPSALDDLGLSKAIDWYARDYLAKRGLDVKIEMHNPRVKLPSIIETMLFRIAQEALANIVKHANATQVKVTLQLSESTIIMQIQDNGKGFDVEAALRRENVRQHLGLHGMAERAALLNGKFIISSQANRGTNLRIEVPVNGGVTV